MIFPIVSSKILSFIGKQPKVADFQFVSILYHNTVENATKICDISRFSLKSNVSRETTGEAAA
jgi:hypothetical protein